MTGVPWTTNSSPAEPSGPGAPPSYRHVYVHVPFCGRRCSYCDFAIAVRRRIPVATFVDAILAEIVTRGIRLNAEDLRTLYLGGGTPSKLGGPGVAALLHGIARATRVDKLPTAASDLHPDLEVTIEINPEDVTAAAAKEWAAAGVNRVSIGVQSFNADVLRWMHREHTPEQVGLAVRQLRDAGIADLSLDLIFALPETLGRDWERDLDGVLALEPNHLSIYGLTVEPHTPLGRWTARGEVAEAPEERYEREFLRTRERLSGAGFEHYEVSNYALPGHRARHNSSYWLGVPYLGLGPSAHGFDGTVRRWNRSALADWERALGAGEDPREGEETLGPAQRAAETVYLGLRTIEGLTIHQTELAMVSRWVDEGWALRSGDRIVLTGLGWLRLDALAGALTSARSHY